MQITIDTKQDSIDDIKKVIRMLQSLVNEEPVTSSPLLQGQSESLFNMFDNSDPSSNASNPPQNSSPIPSKSQDINLDEDEKELGDLPQIVPY
jgi:hypothetical protein